MSPSGSTTVMWMPISAMMQQKAIHGVTADTYTQNANERSESGIKEIYERTQKFREQFKDNPKEVRRSIIRIPVAKPLKTDYKELPLDAYTYGYWLGNGNSVKPELTVRDSDVKDIISFIPYTLHNSYPQNCGGSHILVYKELKKILVKSFRDKVIPNEYLRASESQRWALLQGLMDSDGCISTEKSQKNTQGNPEPPSMKTTVKNVNSPPLKKN